jgi:hypothetical protein
MRGDCSSMKSVRAGDRAGTFSDPLLFIAISYTLQTVFTEARQSRLV